MPYGKQLWGKVYHIVDVDVCKSEDRLRKKDLECPKTNTTRPNDYQHTEILSSEKKNVNL